MADITATLQAKSNQLNAADLIGGPSPSQSNAWT